MHTRQRKLISTFMSIPIIINSLLSTSPANAFLIPIHEDITTDPLEEIEASVDGRKYQFSFTALYQIKGANVKTDYDAIFERPEADFSHHFDDESFLPATTRLKNFRELIVSEITSLSPNGRLAREYLGGALHTIQDFYSHTNWVELGNKEIDPRLGREIFAGLPLSAVTCLEDKTTLTEFGKTELTSGWYPNNKVPPGKCSHGGLFTPKDGIHKDNGFRRDNAKAKELAIKATKDYVSQILTDPRVVNNFKAIKALMLGNGALGFVIDDTGSMGEEINQVKSQVAQIVRKVAGTDNEPSEYLLVRFGDTVGPVFVSSDSNTFLNQVNSLTASGGGKCPELSQSALQLAIASIQENSTLFLFTDASAEDARLASSVNTSAQEKQISITPLLTGSCSPIDPVYARNARETGGQMFVLNPSEVSRTFDLVRPQLNGKYTPLMIVNDSLSGNPQTINVPIDSTVSQAVFSTFIDTKQNVILRKPSGEIVMAGSGNTITNLQNGAIFTIDKPEIGIWKVEVAGNGKFSLSVKANTSLKLADFNFVSIRESDIHRGLFAINGQPLTGMAQMAKAIVSGEFSSAKFEILNERGELIQPLTLATGNAEASSDDFIGSFTPPNQYFRVSVTGLDKTGNSYRRLFPTLFRPQPISITISNAPKRELAIGEITTIKYRIKNLGNRDTFQLVASSSGNFVKQIRPSRLSLSKGASAEVEVDLTAPLGTPVNSRALISTTVNSTRNPDIKNGSTLNLTVVAQKGVRGRG